MADKCQSQDLKPGPLDPRASTPNDMPVFKSGSWLFDSTSLRALVRKADFSFPP